MYNYNAVNKKLLFQANFRKNWKRKIDTRKDRGAAADTHRWLWSYPA